jgi:hypothetical protein
MIINNGNNLKIKDLLHPKMFEKYEKLFYSIELEFFMENELNLLETDEDEDDDANDDESDKSESELGNHGKEKEESFQSFDTNSQNKFHFYSQNRKSHVLPEVPKDYLSKFISPCCESCHILCYDNKDYHHHTYSSSSSSFFHHHPQEHDQDGGNPNEKELLSHSFHAIPYHLISYLHFLLLYRTGGIYSDFSFYFTNRLDQSIIHQGYYLHSYCTHYDQNNKELKLFYPKLYDNWQELQCFVSSLYYFQFPKNLLLHCLLKKYEMDKVFLICIDSDTFYHGANCIKEALDQCLYDISLDFQTKRKQFQDQQNHKSFFQQFNLPLPLLYSTSSSSSSSSSRSVASSANGNKNPKKNQDSLESNTPEPTKSSSADQIEIYYYPFLVNSFSNYLPSSLQQNIPPPPLTVPTNNKGFSGGLRGSKETTSFNTNSPSNSGTSHRSSSPSSAAHFYAFEGILESFHSNPLIANQTILSPHNWTVSSNTHIIWMGQLAWEQVVYNHYYREHQQLTWKNKYKLPIPIFHNVHSYPYPHSSLLSLAERRNYPMKLLKNHFDNNNSSFSSLIQKSFDNYHKNSQLKKYLCQFACDSVQLPEYLVYYFQKKKDAFINHPTSSNHQDVVATTSFPVHTPKPTMNGTAAKARKPIHSSSILHHSTKTTSENHTSMSHHHTQEPVSSVAPLKTLPPTTVNISSPIAAPSLTLNDSHPIHVESKSNSSISVITTMNISISSSMNNSNNTAAHRRHRRRRLSSINVPKIFKSESIMRRNRTMYIFPLTALNDRSLFSSGFNQQPQQQLQQQYFIPKSNTDDEQHPLWRKDHSKSQPFCNPSIFIVGFTHTNSWNFLHFLQSHPLILSGYSGWTNAVSLHENPLLRENGCYNIITSDLFQLHSTSSSSESSSSSSSEAGVGGGLGGHHDHDGSVNNKNQNNYYSPKTTGEGFSGNWFLDEEIHDPLFYRSKCYPYVEKNDSFIILDPSFAYNLNPFTPHVIKQVSISLFNL